MIDRADIEPLLKRLRRTCRVSRTVRVYLRAAAYCAGAEVDGFADEDRKSGDYVIFVSTKGRKLGNVLETLCHEWAHVMDYDTRNWHDDHWGRCYSQAYQCYEQECD